MEGDLSGGDGGEGSADDGLLNINDSNKCHCLSPIESPTAVNDDQVETKSTTALNDDNPDIDGEVEDDILVDADVDIAVDNVQDLLAAAVDVDMFVDHFHDFEPTAPVENDQVEDDLAIDKHLPVMSRKKRMPKRKHKFGKGAKRGGGRKSCWHVESAAPVNPTAIARVDPTALTCCNGKTHCYPRQTNE
jgi:hypothetical protein